MRKIRALSIKAVTSFIMIANVLLLSPAQSILAEDIPIKLKNDLVTWSDTVKLTANKLGETGIDVKYDTNASDETYNYAAVSSIFDGAYGTKPVFSDLYGGITLDVECGDSPVYVNVSFTDTENNRIVMKQEGSSMYETGTEKEMVKTTFGSIGINASDKGKIIIPLDMFVEDENNKSAFDYKKLASWTVGILIEGKQSSELKINELSWTDKNYIQKYATSFDSYIDGSDSIQIPEHGESIADYAIHSVSGNTYAFVSTGYDEGISVDETGRVTLTTKVKEQDIVLKAVDKNGVEINKKITLSNSWRAGNEDFPFYGPDELESISYDFDNVSDKEIDYMRIALVAGCVIVFVSYVVFYAVYKTGRNKEEE